MSNSTTPSVSRLDQRAAAGDRQPRLGLAVDDLEVEPGLGLDRAQEFFAVLGRAAGLGGDQPRAPDRAVARACRRRSSAPRRRGPWPAGRAGRCADSPSPSRTMREKASMTRNWPGRVGTATSSRQLLVPRSSAAKTGSSSTAARPAGGAGVGERLAGGSTRAGSCARRCRTGAATARPAPRQRRHGRARKPCGRACACAASCRAALSRAPARCPARARSDRAEACASRPLRPSRSAHCG